MNQPVSVINPPTEEKPKQSEIPTRPIIDPVTNEPIKVTDRDLMIYLIYMKLMWAEMTKKEGYRTIFIFTRSDVIEKAIEKWRSPEPIAVADIREVFMAERIFNSAVHDKF
jgi:hypothetical protein